MRITDVTIRNFRLLKKVNLGFHEQTTVVVGRNNSGKTSLTELFRRMLNDTSPTFQLEDFSLSTHDRFWESFKLHLAGKDEDEIRTSLPFIELRINVSYIADAGDLGTLSDFIIDLDPESTDVVLQIRYEIGDGQTLQLFDGIALDGSLPESKQKDAFFKELKERIPRKYLGTLTTVDPTDETNTRSMEWTRLHALLQSGFINAQRGLDDTTHQNRDVLGKILGALFRAASSELAGPEDKDTAKDLKSAVERMQQDVGQDFDEHLTKLMPALELFGYPGLADPNLQTETTFDVEGLLAGHTNVRYTGVNGITLPESYNGLGTRNLILILLQLLEFFKAFQVITTTPGVHVIFIEEPEAHLHPQMQDVFVKKLSEIAHRFAQDYSEGNPWPVQFVISTHSPHMANAAPFDSIRYFVASPEEPDSNICTTDVKDLSKGLGGVSNADQAFLHKYMTLTRCDLLFADKAVLIEGSSERILFPKIVEKFDAGRASSPQLSSQYVSVVEVGGAYAHLFFGLLGFLELRTLVITDLDSIDAGGKACKVSVGIKSSNSCLTRWFNDIAISPADLISKATEEKTRESISIAFQVPEVVGGPCGRSFEDSFMLANQSLFEIETGTDADREEAAWLEATRGLKKTDFALKYAIDHNDWSIPRYISDGLTWLTESSSDEEGQR